jgi:FixJ family two-component response regulator
MGLFVVTENTEAGSADSAYRFCYTGSQSESHSTPVVFLVSDDPADKASLESLTVREGWQLEALGSAGEFLAQPRPLVPSCLILTLSFSTPSCIEVQRQIANARSETRIIVVSSYADTPTTVQAIKAGATDFLLKPLCNDVLANAIRQSLEQSGVALNCEAEIRQFRNSYASLTPRERQVFALLLSGSLNKQIGAELGISEITVKAHRRQVMQKMKSTSIAVLARMAARLESRRS